MNTLSYKTVSANAKTVNKQWVVIDAQGEILGRLSSKIAMIIRGKHKPEFTPNVDCGDNVIVINADKVKLTGNKLNDKQYVSYTGYPGGQKFISPKELLAKHPTRVVEKAVRYQKLNWAKNCTPIFLFMQVILIRTRHKHQKPLNFN